MGFARGGGADGSGGGADGPGDGPGDGRLAAPGRGALPAPGDGGPPGVAAPGAEPGATDAALLAYLLANRGSTRWLVAAESANGAAGIQLATGEPVMAMGGFSGSDPAPTADELAAYVASGELRYVYLGSGGGGQGGPGGSGRAAGGAGDAPGGAFTPPGGFPPPAGVGGGPLGSGPGGAISARLAWVTAHCSTIDYGGSGGTLYDCATPPAAQGTTTGG